MVLFKYNPDDSITKDYLAYNSNLYLLVDGRLVYGRILTTKSGEDLVYTDKSDTDGAPFSMDKVLGYFIIKFLG